MVHSGARGLHLMEDILTRFHRLLIKSKIHRTLVALLSVPGMILERVVCIQAEQFFEQNNIFGSFQFGFRSHKSTVSELLSLFDELMEEYINETIKILKVLIDHAESLTASAGSERR